MHTLNKILHNWLQQALLAALSSNRDMGTAFRNLLAFLIYNPVQAAQCCSVQTYEEPPTAVTNC